MAFSKPRQRQVVDDFVELRILDVGNLTAKDAKSVVAATARFLVECGSAIDGYATQ